jgi:uncharacterized protein (TIGR02246 family)
MDTRAVVDRHFQAVRENDIEATMADYAEDAVIIAGGAVYRGADEIRSVMQGAFEGLFVPGTYEWPIDSHTVDGDYSVVTWSLTFAGGHMPFGMDAFHVREGKIVMQTGGFYLAAA